jgi:putative Holliday junction resolvase
MMDDSTGESLNEDAKRILGIDVGTRRVGIAISDPGNTFAVGLTTVEVQSTKEIIQNIARLAREYDVSLLVIGLPTNMNGSEGPAAQKVRYVAEHLKEELQIGIEFFDERLTSVIAHKSLRAQGIKPSRNKGLVDQAAAVTILQDYLDRQRYKNCQ